jgi:hypothetical protein
VNEEKRLDTGFRLEHQKFLCGEWKLLQPRVLDMSNPRLVSLSSLGIVLEYVILLAEII